MERIDIFDSRGRKTGKTATKTQAHRHGYWHTAAHVWIFCKGKVLLQKRAAVSAINPCKWDISSAGHVSAGEYPKRTALRELHEELGLHLLPERLKKVKVMPGQIRLGKVINNEFYHVYFCKMMLPKKLVLQKEEVSAVKLFTKKELRTALQKNPKAFVEHGDYWQFILSQHWS
ncbi:MAG: NUDIX domain-containing protein [archaeon]